MSTKYFFITRLYPRDTVWCVLCVSLYNGCALRKVLAGPASRSSRDSPYILYIPPFRPPVRIIRRLAFSLSRVGVCVCVRVYIEAMLAKATAEQAVPGAIDIIR